jgi:hypothetical protein
MGTWAPVRKTIQGATSRILKSDPTEINRNQQKPTGTNG